MNWANRRKAIYFSIISVVILTPLVASYFVFFKKTPTCFDGKKNGSELGVDCGGSCIKLCLRENLAPIVEWARIFEVSSSTYNLVAYIENPNPAAGSNYAPYTFTVFDSQNNELVKREGATIIQPGKRFAVFEGQVRIETENQKIARTEFSFGDMEWIKMDRNDKNLNVNQIRLTRDVPSPRVDATIENNALDDIKNIEAVAIVYDDDGNAIAASRTLVDFISKETTAGVVFTWPMPFRGQYTRCDVPSDVALIIDRSGSMSSDSVTPPEPLTSVKNAAKLFVGAIGKGIGISVVSFASQASRPVDQSLTTSLQRLEQTIDGITIHVDGAQETNISDALDMGLQSITATSSAGRKKSLILLTDGVPTLPKNKGDSLFPSIAASKTALEIKKNGIDIFTIGLGKKINEQVLLDISSGKDYYYRAPSKTDLEAIYLKIASVLCTKHPVIEVITRIFPSTN